MNVLLIREVCRKMGSFSNDILSVINSMYYDSIVEDIVMSHTLIMVGVGSANRRAKDAHKTGMHECGICDKKIVGKHRTILMHRGLKYVDDNPDEEKPYLSIMGYQLAMHTICLHKRYGYMPDFRLNGLIRDPNEYMRIQDVKEERDIDRQIKKATEKAYNEYYRENFWNVMDLGF
jgi:hypothetical protein